jgi:hypothetical protein
MLTPNRLVVDIALEMQVPFLVSLQNSDELGISKRGERENEYKNTICRVFHLLAMLIRGKSVIMD